MNYNPTHLNSENEKNIESERDYLIQLLDRLFVNEEALEDNFLEEISTSPESQEDFIASDDGKSDRIELPKPDRENITVLTKKLPNKPILPWNRYDSPWEASESENLTELESEEEFESLPTNSQD